MTSIFDCSGVEILRKELALPPVLIPQLRVRINLIPFNAIEHSPHLAGSDRCVIDACSASLRCAGLAWFFSRSGGASSDL